MAWFLLLLRWSATQQIERNKKMQLTNVQISNPGSDLNGYLSRVRRFPMLSLEEEQELANRYVDNKDTQAADQLVNAHLRLVVRIAIGYKGYGLPISELISEGNIGLLQAMAKFDPSKGFRFSTYAIWWIKASIQEYILHSWSLVKMGTTAAQKKLFFNLRKLKTQLEVTDERELRKDQVEAIAEELDVSETEVVNMNRRLSGSDHSLNVAISEDGAGEWQDWLVDEKQDHEEDLAIKEELSVRRKLLNEALVELDEREKHIFIERRLKDPVATLDTLAKAYGISRERVRQIEIRSFEKLQKAIKNKIFKRKLTLN